jgi:fructose-bisphosphate aldolase, class I
MTRTVELLGHEADDLLYHESSGFADEMLHFPGSDFVDRIVSQTDRSIQVLRSMQTLYNHGRLAGTGYLSILPVDQGVEHSAGASFAPNPIYFDPENTVRLALDGGCNAFASTLGAVGIVARKYAHKIPLIVKLNHNELLSFPARYDQIFFGQVKQAWDMGAVAVGATVYFGSPESTRQIQEVARAFREAHDLGMATVLWAYLRNPAFQTAAADFHLAADLTGQANHLAATLQADFIKQKQPENNGGFTALHFGKTDPDMYNTLTTPHPIDLTRYQVLNCFAGRAGLINSGGASGKDDLHQAVRAAVINKRAGGMGMIAGRKAFQKRFKEGVELLHAIQDVYLDPGITLA